MVAIGGAMHVLFRFHCSTKHQQHAKKADPLSLSTDVKQCTSLTTSLIPPEIFRGHMQMAEALRKRPITKDDQHQHSNKNLAEPPPPAAAAAPLRPRAAAFSFWAYLTIIVSLVTFLLASLPSLRHPDQRSWFLTLPSDLRRHYSDGKLIKVLPFPDHPPIHIFVADFGPKDSSAEAVLLLHGLGCSSFSFRHILPSLASAGIRAVALDLPGSGFSDAMPSNESPGGIWGVYRDIREKGLFWAFDQLVETGHIPYEERPVAAADRSSGYGSAEMGRVIAQVVNSMELAPVHLVLHDSALGSVGNWVSANSAIVRSVTLIDSAAESAAFPSWFLGVPVLGEVLLRYRSVFSGLLRLCCSRTIDGAAAEAYRLLLRGKDGKKGVAAAGRALNHSFDLGEWAASEALKELPLQILWSNTWSDLWIDEGRRAAAAVPRAAFTSHSGGRWPQEDAAAEIARMITQFVSSLPKYVREKNEEPFPEHIQKMFEEANNGHHHHHHGHGPEHATGYADMHDLGQGWGS